MRTNLVTWVLVMVALVYAIWQFRHGPWIPSRIAGAVIVLIALALISMARFQLGHSFSVTAQARQLVTTGIYSRIRNPIYVFAEFLFVGAALFLWSWWPLVLMLVLIPVQVMRARSEAAVLQAAFGEEYVRYRQGTWF